MKKVFYGDMILTERKGDFQVGDIVALMLLVDDTCRKVPHFYRFTKTEGFKMCRRPVGENDFRLLV